MISWRGKQDAQGALRAWQILLDTNPKLEASKKADVEKLMTEVRQHSKASFRQSHCARLAQTATTGGRDKICINATCRPNRHKQAHPLTESTIVVPFA